MRCMYQGVRVASPKEGLEASKRRGTGDDDDGGEEEEVEGWLGEMMVEPTTTVAAAEAAAEGRRYRGAPGWRRSSSRACFMEAYRRCSSQYHSWLAASDGSVEAEMR